VGSLFGVLVDDFLSTAQAGDYGSRLKAGTTVDSAESAMTIRPYALALVRIARVALTVV